MKLYILEGFENYLTSLVFVGEDDNGKTYNIQISEDDFSSYFGEDIELSKVDFEEIDTEFNDAAQEIVDAFTKGHTDYDVVISAQKLKGYRLTRKSGGFHEIAIEYLVKHYGKIQDFMKKETGYSDFTSIFG